MGDSTRRPAVVRDLGDGHVGLWVHYDDRHLAKKITTARWDPGLKCWRIARLFRSDAEELVHRLNADGRGASTDSTTTGGTAVATITATVTPIFTVIPAHLKEPTFKALARAWHPDRGGDTDAMKALNGAWAAVQA